MSRYEDPRPRMTGIADEAAAGIAEQLACHRTLGWNTLELRSVEGQPLARLSPQQLDAACGEIIHAGFRAPVLDSQIGNWRSDIAEPFEHDLDEFDRLAAVARRLDSRMVRVMSYPNGRGGTDEAAWQREVFRRLALLAERAAGAGIVLVHENCAGWAGRSPAHAQRLLDAVPNPSLQLLFDLGNGLAHGYVNEPWLRALWPRIAHVHVKDARRGSGGQVAYTEPGEGECVLAAGIGFLAARGYRGWWSIEPHLHLIPHHHDAPGQPQAAAYIRYAQQATALVRRALAEAGEGAHVV